MSSKNWWLKRHLKDPFVKKSKEEGYSSRAAYKLLEIDEKFNIIKNATNVLDLGCSPGSWSEVILEKNPKSSITGIDIIETNLNINFIKGDFRDICPTLNEVYDLILSDIAPNTSGHKETDHLRIVVIIKDIIQFTKNNLAKGGSLVLKTFQGSQDKEIYMILKGIFQNVHYHKPKASRKESREIYLVCTKHL